MKVSKLILGIYNSLFVTIGLGFIFLGIYFLLSDGSIRSVVSSSESEEDTDATLNYIILGIGVGIFLISLLGLVATLRESRCLLAFYMVIVLLFLLVQVSGIVILTVNQELFISKLTGGQVDLKNKLAQYLVKNYKNSKQSSDHYYNDPSMSIFSRESFDIIMASFQCCGVSDSTDFHYVFQKNSNTLYYDSQIRLPKSCCKDQKDASLNSNINEHNLNLTHTINSLSLSSSSLFNEEECENPTRTNSNKDTGCLDAVINFYKLLCIIILSVLSTVQLFALLLTIFVFRNAYYDYV